MSQTQPLHYREAEKIAPSRLNTYGNLARVCPSCTRTITEGHRGFMGRNFLNHYRACTRQQAALKERTA